MKRFILILSLSLLGILLLYWILDQKLSTKVEPREINHAEFKAFLYARGDVSNQTAIILIGGGQWGDYWGQFLAQKGFVGLSLPYQSTHKESKLNEEIPLEYYQKAIAWLTTQPEVDPRKVIVMGASRNAELSLLLAATFPDHIHGVIAYAPSAVTWSNTVLPYNSDKIKPSWTFHNQPIPYITMEKIKVNPGQMINTLAYWTKGLEDTLQVEKAFIKVEKINGPILLLSGKDDQVWPASQMSDLIEKRLVGNKFVHPFYNIQYEKAGHLISGDPDHAINQSLGEMIIAGKKYEYRLGGTPEGDHWAKQDARKRVLELISNL